MIRERPIFVLGCPRSGTTLLQVMLHSHPRIAVPPENRFVIESYRRRLEFGDLDQSTNREVLAHWIVSRGNTRFRDYGLDAEQVVAAIVAGPPTIGSVLATVLGCYAERFGKARWGDKRPAYYQDVRALRRLFPDAQFVHLVRDGRDCVASLKRMPWWHRDAYAAIATWTEAIDYGRRWADRLGPETWHELTYERLVTDPERELRRLCGFLGESYHAAMASPRDTAKTAVPRWKTWHVRTGQEVDASRVGAFASGLEGWELELIEHVAASQLRRFGYPARRRGRPPLADLRRYLQVSTARRWRHRRTHLSDDVRDRTSGAPVAAVRRIG